MIVFANIDGDLFLGLGNKKIKDFEGRGSKNAVFRLVHTAILGVQSTGASSCKLTVYVP